MANFKCITKIIIFIGFPKANNTIENEQVPLQQIGELRSQQGEHEANGSRNDADSPDEDNFMKSFGNAPRLLVIFPKIWKWKLPEKLRYERLFYVVLLLGLNGLLIYISLNFDYFFYVLLFLGTHFGLNLIYYFFMKVF